MNREVVGSSFWHLMNHLGQPFCALHFPLDIHRVVKKIKSAILSVGISICRWVWMSISAILWASADVVLFSYHYKVSASEGEVIVSSISKTRLFRCREVSRMAAQICLTPVSVNFLKYYLHFVFICKHGISPAGNSEWIFKRNLSTYLGLLFRPELIVRSTVSHLR